MLDQLIAHARRQVKRRLWLISDLQQSVPAQAERCMTCATADFLALGMPVDAVCYLGDSVEGHDEARLRAMTEMQLREMRKVASPVYYVPGNHDFDYFRHHQPVLTRMVIPFIDRVREDPQWHVSPRMDALYFEADFGDFAVVFLPDHAAEDGAWFTSHGVVRGDAAAYPYTYIDYRDLCAHIASLGKPVFTMSHYNLPGGNREAPLLEQLLPLPKNLFLHFCGHAHIGDKAWAGHNAHRKIAGVDDHAVVQVNVSSLEEGRGSAIRSVFLEWYEDGSAGVLFRNHSLRRWDDCYFTAPKGGDYAASV